MPLCLHRPADLKWLLRLAALFTKGSKDSLEWGELLLGKIRRRCGDGVRRGLGHHSQQEFLQMARKPLVTVRCIVIGSLLLNCCHSRGRGDVDL